MKATIQVKNRAEAEAIQSAMGDPVMRATVVVVGVLLQLKPEERMEALSIVSKRLGLKSPVSVE